MGHSATTDECATYLKLRCAAYWKIYLYAIRHIFRSLFNIFIRSSVIYNQFDIGIDSSGRLNCTRTFCALQGK